jgi:hypothetical protein
MLEQIRRQESALKGLLRFLDWLLTRSDVHLCRRHQHSSACRDSGQAIECGLVEGAPEEMTAQDALDLKLAERYLGIDFARGQREEAEVEVWMNRDRPGGQAA